MNMFDSGNPLGDLRLICLEFNRHLRYITWDPVGTVDLEPTCKLK